MPIPDELKEFQSNKGKDTFIRTTIKNFSFETFSPIYSLLDPDIGEEDEYGI